MKGFFAVGELACDTDIGVRLEIGSSEIGRFLGLVIGGNSELSNRTSSNFRA